MSAERDARLDELFRASQGKPVQFGGQLVRMAFDIPVNDAASSGYVELLSFNPSRRRDHV